MVKKGTPVILPVSPRALEGMEFVANPPNAISDPDLISRYLQAIIGHEVVKGDVPLADLPILAKAGVDFPGADQLKGPNLLEKYTRRAGGGAGNDFPYRGME